MIVKVFFCPPQFPDYTQAVHLLCCIQFSVQESGQSLKTMDTIGNCQRLVFTLGVSQHMHKITNL